MEPGIDKAEVNRKVKQWMEHADDDLKIAEHSLTLSTSIPYYIVAYHAQQCAEKYLKAFLVFCLEDFPYTHNLGLLLDLCAKHGTWVSEVQTTVSLTDFAITARYPGEARVSREEALFAIQQASRVKDVVYQALLEKGLIISN